MSSKNFEVHHNNRYLRAVMLLFGIIGLPLCFFWNSAYPESVPPLSIYHYKAYAGIMGGYGSTIWDGLVPTSDNQNVAMNISTPIAVEEGGGVWGLLLGYELTPYFAIEANYVHYPKARIFFDENSLFAFDHEGETELNTRTETVSILAKFMLVLPSSNIRAYSSAGVARVQRTDTIAEDYRISPTFGVGINTNITERVMAEIGVNYTAGYGESEINPANDYVPFLYSVFTKLAYRF